MLFYALRDDLHDLLLDYPPACGRPLDRPAQFARFCQHNDSWRSAKDKRRILIAEI